MSSINIKTEKKRFPVAKDLYGLFFEDISRAGDGGLYPEMIRNRSFEDSLLPEGCTTSDGGKTFVSPTGWIEEFNNGEGMSSWVRDSKIQPTPVPGWYAENASMTLDKEMVLNPKRKVSLKVNFATGGQIRNIGYTGVPQAEGKTYDFYMFARAEKDVTLDISIRDKEQISSSAKIEIKAGDWTRYDAKLDAGLTTGKGEFYITCPEEATVYFGFVSLMPSETFMGHGLRLDLAEKLRDMNPAFLRFPGGCIVEGFSMETVWYFKNTIGPVWERPSHWLLWHYRATNGLGFHEYLQLCEDLDVAPLYVCNCGMTCQGRCPRYFNEEEQREMMEDIFAALEYALGDSSTKWGKVRASMGHPEPFRLDYLEIGNENSGPEYDWRYDMIREAVLEKYPKLIIVTNDRGKTKKLEADIADDHYYNMPEFFAEGIHIYDNYDRSEPDIFVGEFSVNQTYEGQLRAAVGEAMFMLGMERNQDKVKLCSFAPLFQHINYGSWFPNLIIYDTLKSFVIPSYYSFRILGGNRGDNVVESEEDVKKIYYDIHGLPALSGDDGVRYKNPVWNGETVSPSRDILAGHEIDSQNEITVYQKLDKDMPEFPFKVYPLVTLGEDLEVREGVFEVDAYYEAGKDIALGVLASPKPLSYYDRTNPNPTDPWSMRFLEVSRWIISDGKSYVARDSFPTKPISDSKEVHLKENEFNHLKYIVSGHYITLEINGETIDTVELPYYPAMGTVVTDTETEVIVKIVNFSDEKEDVEITLDCDVESEYTVNYLKGNATDENSLDAPDNVHDEFIQLSGAARSFTYEAPALSVNALRLKKRK